MVKNSSEHILELAKELLDDIELSRVAVEPLLLKASRLARWTGSEEIKRWIELELRGYSAVRETELKFIDISGRWGDKKEGTLYNVPLAQIAILIDTENIKLKSMSTPDTSGDWAFRVMQMYEKNLQDSTENIMKLSGIKSKVLAHLHSFITDIYYEKEFDFLSESIFESYKNEVDSLISKNCGSVLEQIPSVMARLSDGNNESISQALTTVRRIIDSFADSIYPPSDNTINIDGNDIKLDASKHQNRINAFVHEKIESSSRKRKIRQNLSNLYDRVSTGVHKDVSVEEAKSLFLNTYLLLGEVLHISKIDLK
ncbi:MAG: hypothetical protein WCS55_08845 [Sulfuricurvum sp.]|uniref:AbiTii domain-containing protein n=1 Tax=Sulfuricurvum sp. TaxID=2025608 RepID=UPI0035616F13